MNAWGLLSSKAIMSCLPSLLTTFRLAGGRGLRLACVLLTIAVSLVGPSEASGQQLEGVVRDAWTGEPAADVRVGVDGGGGGWITTDSTGAYSLPVSNWEAADVWVWTPETDAPVRWTNQRPETRGQLWTAPDAHWDPEQAPVWGAPLVHRPLPEVALPNVPGFLRPFGDGGPLGAVLPSSLPTHIRVGRRMASSCSGNPVQRIDTVPLEEYVQGVLTPEIGVFKRIAGGPESSRAVFQAFAIAARSYAVWFWVRNPDAEFHIDDTACTQRYEDVRDAFVAETVAATAGLVLVQASDNARIEKYEYAASCGRHGSRPYGQTPTVPDVTGQVACVGTWCGHNNCAAHEDHPGVPGTDRCLVRGVCQWGSAERSMRGDTWQQILAHYQPNLVVIRAGAVAPDPTPATARLVGYVRWDDIFTGTGVDGVTVRLDSGATATTRADGFFELTAPVGDQVMTYSGGGIVEIRRDKLVEAGVTNWASVAATRATTPPPDPDPEPDPVADPQPDAGLADVGDTDLPDTAPADVGLPPDAIEEDTAVADVALDTAAPPDSGEEPPDTGVETGSDEVGRPRPPFNDTSADGQSAVPTYAIVGPEGVGDTGCACAAAPRGFGGWLLVPVVMLGLGRRRRVC